MNQAVTRNTLAVSLLAAGRERVLSYARAAARDLTVQPLQPAEAGLALMQWRDAVMHQPFYLGEVPVARAAVAVSVNGERVEGGAIVMADDADLAQALAVLDAVWAHRLPGAEDVDELAQIGARARACLRAERQAMLKRTRVDFSLLSEAEDEEEE
jgi:alpha-D-ribose 1-methylphosphonate 5-triphosphate synthase subunit PhnG